MEELFSEFYINLRGKELDEDRIKEITNLLVEIEGGEV